VGGAGALFGPGAGPEGGGQEPAVGVVERVVGGQDAGEHGDGVAVDVEGGLAEAGAAEEELGPPEAAVGVDVVAGGGGHWTGSVAVVVVCQALASAGR